MKTKLKTLKDLKIFGYLNEEGIYEGDEGVDIEQLKAEAVKEIKEFSKSPREVLDIEDGTDIDFSNKNVIEYIKWKNNLTEEDLK